MDLLKDSSVFDAKKESLVITNPSDSAGAEMSVIRSGNSNTKSGILLKNLKVIYVDPKGHAAIIETDIRLGVPAVQFPTPSTLPDLMNMIVVADGGIVCEGNAESESRSREAFMRAIAKEQGRRDRHSAGRTFHAEYSCKK